MSNGIGSIEDLLSDKGTIQARGPIVVEPQADGDVAQFHHVGTLTYLDDVGHWHAVLIDTVSTGTAGGARLTTLEILSDVVITSH